jgi:hypothetical protein
MLDRSKGRGQTKCSPWFSRLRVGCGAKDPTQENLLFSNYGGGQDPHRVAAPVKKKNELNA